MEYKDYITCFANRSKKVLEKFSKCDKDDELNVTALLSVASTAFVIPFERLKDNHPFADRDKFDSIAKKIDNELKKKFNNSKLFCGESWKIQSIISDLLNKEDDFIDDKFCMIDDNMTVKTIVDIIRNTLAHGNIHSCSKNGTGYIDTLYFVSKRSSEKDSFFKALENSTNSKLSNTKKNKIYNDFIKSRNSATGFCIIQCSIEDFRNFFNKWLKLLTSTEAGQN